MNKIVDGALYMRHLADEKLTANNNNKFLPKNGNNEPALFFVLSATQSVMSHTLDKRVRSGFWKSLDYLKNNSSTFSQELFEVKDDEEQRAKLQDICDLLLAAGYFRVRLKGLSAFDKVCINNTIIKIYFTFKTHLLFVRLLEAWSGAWNFVQLMLMSTSCFEKTSTLVKRCRFLLSKLFNVSYCFKNALPPY